MKLITLLIFGLLWTSSAFSQISEHDNSTIQSNEEITLTLYVKGADFSQSISDIEDFIQSFGGKKIVSSIHNSGSPIIKINLWEGSKADLEEVLNSKNINAFWVIHEGGTYYMVSVKTQQRVEMKQGEIDKISADL